VQYIDSNQALAKEADFGKMTSARSRPEVDAPGQSQPDLGKSSFANQALANGSFAGFDWTRRLHPDDPCRTSSTAYGTAGRGCSVTTNPIVQGAHYDNAMHYCLRHRASVMQLFVLVAVTDKNLVSNGLRGASDSRGPRLHDMRHRFATNTLVQW
jgi:hypothetical protein